MSRVFEALGAIEGTNFLSEGDACIGVTYIGAGEGKKPTVVLLHGFPGLEKNVDIAYALREMGWNVLLPHYRGCWGSNGKYRFTGMPNDIRSAITMMESKPYVDPEKIFLVGHSMGAWVTVVVSAQDKRVKGAVSIAGGATSTDPSSFRRTYGETLINSGFLKNVTADELQADWQRMGKELAAQDLAGKISPRPLLVIGGAQDATVPPERVKMVYDSAKDPKKLVIIEDADHTFTKKRRELVKTVTDWLKAQI